jgi:membrane-associated protease RseP (regulator of RpoE activity)
MAFIPGGSNLLNYAIFVSLWINIFWGFINLMPVFPLDGGQVSMQLFMHFDPGGGIRNALWLSVIAGAALAVAGYAVMGSFYMAFLFGILALQSFQALNGRGGSFF